MRDYAKKNFQNPSNTDTLSDYTHPSHAAYSNTANQNSLDAASTLHRKYFGIALFILILCALFTGDLIYKHFHTHTANPNSTPNLTLAKNNPQAPAQPVFDFYNKLPQQTAINNTPPNLNNSPQSTTPIQNTASTSTTATHPLSKKTTYNLTLGAYRNKNEAQQTMAKLILMGYQPHLTFNNNTQWYQVNLGPYKNSNIAKAMRRKLENTSQFSAVRLSPAPTAL